MKNHGERRNKTGERGEMKIGHVREFLSLHPKDKKVDYHALANQVRLEIDLNNQGISSYITYLIGLVTIVLSLYLFLIDNGINLVYSIAYLLLSLGAVLFFVYKINRIIKKNEKSIEGYMGIQGHLAGSKMFVLEGTPEEIKKTLENLNKIPGLEKKDLMDITTEEIK